MEIVSTGINLRRKKSWMYVSILTFLFLGFFSLLTSKIYIKTEEKLYHSELKKSIALSGTRTAFIEERQFNPEKHFMEIVMRIEGGDDDKLEFIAQEKARPNVKLPVKTVYRENENFVLQIQDMSSNWEALAIDIYDVNSSDVTLQDMDIKKEDDSKNVFIKTLFADQKKTEVNAKLTEKTKESYALQFISIEKNDIKEKMKKIDTFISLQSKQEKHLRDEIGEMKYGMKYQTDNEKIDTESKIASKESMIAQMNQGVEEYKKELEDMKDKIKKLEEKEKDLL